VLRQSEQPISESRFRQIWSAASLLGCGLLGVGALLDGAYLTFGTAGFGTAGFWTIVAGLATGIPALAGAFVSRAATSRSPIGKSSLMLSAAASLLLLLLFSLNAIMRMDEPLHLPERVPLVLDSLGMAAIVFAYWTEDELEQRRPEALPSFRE